MTVEKIPYGQSRRRLRFFPPATSFREAFNQLTAARTVEKIDQRTILPVRVMALGSLTPYIVLSIDLFIDW